MDMDKYHMPQHLDEPMKFLLWTIDELVAFLVPFVLMMLAYNQVIVGGLLGGALVYGLRKIKGEQGHYFLFNVLYWYLPNFANLRTTPPSHIRELIG